MAELPQVANEGDLVTLAEVAIGNVFDQLEIDNPELAEEIKQVMRNEIRRIEVELSIMIMDMRESFTADIKELKEKGVLPEAHMLNVLGEKTDASNG